MKRGTKWKQTQGKKNYVVKNLSNMELKKAEAVSSTKTERASLKKAEQLSFQNKPWLLMLIRVKKTLDKE